ncbi:hypothetical protein PAPYR_6414 [Paratrimastix pyriformis]|uniref:Uncharacterized protein n=1 Tax=Paratrimastix pyriformis TaxID=342808 RepID=A0ABQ8UII6_9EUKA|nr:hypothetical protein PAPYR_6414 [Paratrimastix pyriformis]
MIMTINVLAPENKAKSRDNNIHNPQALKRSGNFFKYLASERTLASKKAKRTKIPPVKVDQLRFSPLALPLRLPLDLLPVLVETSESPMRTYTQLLSICHTTRTAVRGSPRGLAWRGADDDDNDEGDPLIRQVTTPTAEALAALVGPCLGLVKLTLDFETLPEHWCDLPEAASDWVGEAFAGHNRLAVLEIAAPWFIIHQALPAIVGHLHGLEEFRLDGGWQLNRLERLELPDMSATSSDWITTTLARLLTGNMATLRSLNLTVTLPIGQYEAIPLSQLEGLLDGLPELMSLTLTLQRASFCPIAQYALRPGLLDRLEHLAFHFQQRSPVRGARMRIASRHLRTLSFDYVEGCIPIPAAIELTCPRLEELVLPERGGGLTEFVMDCPQLRSIKGLPGYCRHRWKAMPRLVRVRGRGCWADGLPLSLDGLPQLLEGSPRLPVDVLPHLPPPWSMRALQLPAQLAFFRATVDLGWTPTDPPPDLLVESTGLRALAVWLLPRQGDFAVPRRLSTLNIHCPALMAFHADLSRFASLALVGPPPPLLNLAVRAELAEAVLCLPNCLAMSATTLRRVSLHGRAGRPRPGGPRHADVVLALPHLRRLNIEVMKLRSLVLHCPLLEMLHLCGFPSADVERCELIGPPPRNLHLDIEAFSGLARRFSWMKEFPCLPR